MGKKRHKNKFKLPKKQEDVDMLTPVEVHEKLLKEKSFIAVEKNRTWDKLLVTAMVTGDQVKCLTDNGKWKLLPISKLTLKE